MHCSGLARQVFDPPILIFILFCAGGRQFYTRTRRVPEIRFYDRVGRCLADGPHLLQASLQARDEWGITDANAFNEGDLVWDTLSLLSIFLVPAVNTRADEEALEYPAGIRKQPWGGVGLPTPPHNLFPPLTLL